MSRDTCTECKKDLHSTKKDRWEYDSRLFCSRRCVALFQWKGRPA